MEDGIGLFFLSFLDCNSTSVQWKLCLNEGMFFYKAKHKIHKNTWEASIANLLMP